MPARSLRWKSQSEASRSSRASRARDGAAPGGRRVSPRHTPNGSNDAVSGARADLPSTSITRLLSPDLRRSSCPAASSASPVCAAPFSRPRRRPCAQPIQDPSPAAQPAGVVYGDTKYDLQNQQDQYRRRLRRAISGDTKGNLPRAIAPAGTEPDSRCRRRPRRLAHAAQLAAAYGTTKPTTTPVQPPRPTTTPTAGRSPPGPRPPSSRPSPSARSCSSAAASTALRAWAV